MGEAQNSNQMPAGVQGTQLDVLRLAVRAKYPASVYGERIAEIALQLKINAGEVCTPVGYARDLAEHPELAGRNDILPVLPAYLDNAALVGAMMRTQLGEFLVDDAVKYNTILCQVPRDSTAGGNYHTLNGIDTVTYARSDTKPVFNPLYAGYEELTHAHYNHRRQSDPDKIPIHLNTAADYFINAIENEASSKVSKAIGLFQQAEAVKDDNPRFIESFMTGISGQMEPDMDLSVMEAVKKVYDEHGLDEIYSNPSLLLPAHVAFYKGFSFRLYEDRLLETAKANRDILAEGPEISVPFDVFKNQYGHLPGMIGNIFDGGPYNSMRDLLGELPAESTIRTYFRDHGAPLPNDPPQEAASDPAGSSPKIVASPLR